MNQPGPVLRVRGLSARIGQQQVVEDVTLEVPAQGVTAPRPPHVRQLVK